jgi:hypothetical protein
MSELALEDAERKPVAIPAHAPGSVFFALMAGLWGAFVALLAVSPSTLDDAFAWLRGLPFVWEALMWIVTLPWTVAYLAYDASWEHWLRVVVVAVIVGVHLTACAPRVPRPRG